MIFAGGPFWQPILSSESRNAVNVAVVSGRRSPKLPCVNSKECMHLPEFLFCTPRFSVLVPACAVQSFMGSPRALLARLARQSCAGCISGLLFGESLTELFLGPCPFDSARETGSKPKPESAVPGWIPAPLPWIAGLSGLSATVLKHCRGHHLHSESWILLPANLDRFVSGSPRDVPAFLSCSWRSETKSHVPSGNRCLLSKNVREFPSSARTLKKRSSWARTTDPHWLRRRYCLP